MKKIIYIATALLALWPGWAACFEPVTDEELAATSGAKGLALRLYADKILEDPGLTPEEAEELWENMTPGERERARRKFRQELMEMAPEKRSEVRRKMLERFLSLSPEEQETIKNNMRDRVERMSPEEQREYLEFRRQMLEPPPDSMPPEEKMPPGTKPPGDMMPPPMPPESAFPMAPPGMAP